jgi:SNF2-related domain
MFTKVGRGDRKSQQQRWDGDASEDEDDIVKFHCCYTLPVQDDIEDNNGSRLVLSHSMKRRVPNVFPPLLHTNVNYTNGIRLYVDEVVKYEQDQGQEGGIDDGTKGSSFCRKDHLLIKVPPYYYYDPQQTSSPSSVSLSVLPPPIQLTLTQSYLWSVPHMAQYIVSVFKRTISGHNKRPKNIKANMVMKPDPTGTAKTSSSSSPTSSPTIVPPYNPCHTFRLLGTITRKLYSTPSRHCDVDELESLLALVRDSKIKRSELLRQTYAKQHRARAYKVPPTHPTTTTQGAAGLTKTAINSIDTTWQRRLQKRNVVAPTNPDEMDVNQDENMEDQDESLNWSDLWNANISSDQSSTCPWNPLNGDLLSHTVGHDFDYISVSELLRLLQQLQLRNAREQAIPKDLNSESHVYQNPQDPFCKFMSTINELLDILKACQELSNPTELWNVPLLMVYPILTEESQQPKPQCYGYDNKHPKVATIQLAIYGHRLLMETYTTTSLHILLNKLDTDSYHVTIPKCSATAVFHNSNTVMTNRATNNNDTDHRNNAYSDDPIFVSSAYPIVVYNQKDNHQLKPQKVTTTATKAKSSTTKTTSASIATITTTTTSWSRQNITDTNPPEPSLKKQKVTHVTDDNDDKDDDRKLPAHSRKLSPSSTTVMELDEQQQPSSAFDSSNTINDNDDTNTTTPFVVNTVSAFSPMGLLKILENDGCHPDRMIPNWYNYFMTHLQPLLTSSTATVRLPLLPHQQYAIVWMYHMEHLPNFGINSLFWEEREFLDWYDIDDRNDPLDASITIANSISNKYYVNTALGQIRFEPPETMKGGLLCDEMGLGTHVFLFFVIFFRRIHLFSNECTNSYSFFAN